MKKKENKKDFEPIYLFLYFLYLIVLMPKQFQMPVIIFLFLYILRKNKWKIWTEKTGLLFSLVGMIQLLSITLNLMSNYDTTRVLAAVNTGCLWIFAGLFYSFIKENGLNKEKVNKAMFLNIILLLILGVFMLLCQKNGKTDVSLFSRSLMRVDWSYGEKKYRLRAFLLYDTLVPMLYFLIFPFAYEFIEEKKGNLFKLLFISISILPVILSKSRIGIILVLWLYANIFPDLIAKNKKQKQLITIMMIFFCVIICLFNYQRIIEVFIELINSRGGSTSTRRIIYQESIKRVIQNSPIVGCGIKEMLGSYPLGSHSTYIGLIYKVGFLGFFIAMIALWRIFKESIKMRHYYLISTISLYLMFLTEDLDGENWLIILFGVLYGFIAYKNRQKVIVQEGKND